MGDHERDTDDLSTPDDRPSNESHRGRRMGPTWPDRIDQSPINRGRKKPTAKRIQQAISQRVRVAWVQCDV